MKRSTQISKKAREKATLCYAKFSAQASWAIVLQVVIVTIIFFLLSDTVRAALFYRDLKAYSESSQVSLLAQRARSLQIGASDGDKALFCEFNVGSLIGAYNRAYSNTQESADDRELQALRSSIQSLRRPPTYTTYTRIIPNLIDAQKESRRYASAWESLQALDFYETTRSYCLDMQKALANVYFIGTLKQADGINALLPGQRDGFRNATERAKQLAQNMPYPVGFKEEHLKINEIIVNVANALVTYSDSPKAQAERFQNIEESLSQVLREITEKTTDLQRLPDAIVLFSSTLQKKE